MITSLLWCTINRNMIFKMDVMLGDNCTYKKLNNDAVAVLQRKMNRQLLQLKNKK